MSIHENPVSISGTNNIENDPSQLQLCQNTQVKILFYFNHKLIKIKTCKNWFPPICQKMGEFYTLYALLTKSLEDTSKSQSATKSAFSSKIHLGN